MALNLLEQLPPQSRLSTAAIHAQAEAVGYTRGPKNCRRFLEDFHKEALFPKPDVGRFDPLIPC